MGIELQSKSYFLGYHSMRDLNEDSTSCNWPQFYEDNTSLSNGHYSNGFLPMAASDVYDKDVFKQKILEHEAIFKNKVYELPQYKIQRDLMEDIKRRGLHGNRIPTESSLSSSPLGYHTTPEDVQKWQSPMFLSTNTVDGRSSSISGASATASPLNCIREKNAQVSPFEFQREGNSRNSNILESRPAKVRRKLLDLELPASEYIDTEDVEHAKDEDLSGSSTNLNDRNCGLDNGTRIFLNNGVQDGCQVGASGLPSKNCLTDLNEPVKMEGTNFGVGKRAQASYGEECLLMEPQSLFVRLPKETVLNSHQFDGMPNNLLLRSQENDKGWLSRVLQSDSSRDGSYLSSEAPERGYRTPSAVRLDSVTTSQIPSPFLGGLSSSAQPWSHGISSWETQSGTPSQKLTTTYMHPCFSSSTFSGSSQPSKQNHGIFSNGSHINKSNQNYGSESLKQNGFNLGSSSRSKELPVHVLSLVYGYPSCSPGFNSTSGRFLKHGYAKHYNGSHVTDPKYANNLNLNAEPPNYMLNEQHPRTDVEIIDLESKNDGILPWLRPKSVCDRDETDLGTDSISGKLGFLNSSRQSFVNKENENFATSLYASSVKSSSHSRDNEASRTEIRHCPKILGVPLFDKPFNLKDESASVPPPSSTALSSESEVLNKRINIALDINLPCDPELDLEEQIIAETWFVKKDKDTNGVNFRHQIDLNSFADEDENCLLPLVVPTTEKVALDIDLEAPYIDETEDNDNCIEGHIKTPKTTEGDVNPLIDKLVKVAADAIVLISSSELQGNLEYISDRPSEASTPDPLGWFAEIVSTCGNTIISNSKPSLIGKRGHDNGYENTSLGEIDYFEMMILKLTECSEEDYMPRPLVPEDIVIEETSTSLLTNRPRRGQARRGRLRKDFQRDILPGLASLSRHEVTEDIQTFGGLMRATGHSWSSRPGRRTSARNNCGIGRRCSLVSSPPAMATSSAGTPLIQQLNSVEAGAGLKDRNLRGWGKTTRRPRRQRCPSGNLLTLPVT